jgi:hypothetical protein
MPIVVQDPGICRFDRRLRPFEQLKIHIRPANQRAGYIVAGIDVARIQQDPVQHRHVEPEGPRNVNQPVNTHLKRPFQNETSALAAK